MNSNKLQNLEHFVSKILKDVEQFSTLLQQVFHVLIDYKEGCLLIPSSVLTEHPNNSFPSISDVPPLYCNRKYTPLYIS